MKRRLICLLMGVALAGLLAGPGLAADPRPKEGMKDMSVVYKVVSPVGEPTIKLAPITPRLDTLAGKTVCEVWNNDFRGDETFPIIRGMLKERFAGIKVIPYTEFPLVSNVSLFPENKEKTLGALRAALKGKGCQAVIAGNGG